jgi:flavodoxin
MFEMKALVVYDTNYGNTERVAQQIAATLGSETSVRAVKVDAVQTEDLVGLDVLVVGGPVNAWRPTRKIQAFLKGLSPELVSGVKAAAFDTRFGPRLAGSAADNIEQTLRQQGCEIVAPAKGFLVLGMQGPLADAQLDAAAGWAKQILESTEPRS